MTKGPGNEVGSPVHMGTERNDCVLFYCFVSIFLSFLSFKWNDIRNIPV